VTSRPPAQGASAENTDRGVGGTGTSPAGGLPTDSSASAGAARSESRAPAWLVALVFVVLAAVLGVAGFVVTRAAQRSAVADPSALAIERWTQEVEGAPGDVDALVGLGYAYQEADRLEEALETYDEVLALDPGELTALYNRAVVLLALGRAQEGEAGLLSVLEIAPDHVLAAKRLATAYVGDERYREALGVLEPVVVAQPQYADLQYLAGVACERLGRTQDAVEYYRAAIRYSPDLTEAADALERLGAEDRS